MGLSEDYAITFAWAIDFIKAIEDKPWYIKVLLRPILGKYAFNEYLGLRNHLATYHYIDMGYECENMDYHNKNHPYFWWHYDPKD